MYTLDNIANLGDEERAQLLTFLLYRMSQETRRKVMGRLPVIYLKMNPGVDIEKIVAEIKREAAS